MVLHFLPMPVSAMQLTAEMTACNQTTAKFGLILSPADAQELIDTKDEALSRYRRIEFGGGIMRKMIIGFCDSPYIFQQNYTGTLHELIEIFYYFKNELPDTFPDDELIDWMKKSFDGSCRVSLELLKSRELETLARGIRYGDDEADACSEQNKAQFEEDDYEE